MINKYRPYYPTTIEDLNNEIALIKSWLARWRYSPLKWGPRLWYYIHTTTIYCEELSLTDTQWKSLQQWAHSLNQLIPCIRCRIRKPGMFHVATPQQLTSTLIEYHNTVNRKLGKRVLTEEEARALYTNFCRRR